MKKVYLIAVVFALIAGFATFFFASEIDKKTTIKDADIVEVLVPVADIPKNTAIKPEMFAEESAQFVTKTFIADDLPQDVAKTQEELIDMVTLDPIYAGEAINTKRLQPLDGSDVSLSLKIAKGKVAYSFSTASTQGVDGYISEGDTVDVIVFDEKTGDPTIVYKDLKIFRLSNATASKTANSSGSAITEYSSITVEVTQKEALELYKIENNGGFKLILNHRE